MDKSSVIVSDEWFMAYRISSYIMSHLLVNRITLLALSVFWFIKSTGSYESFVSESHNKSMGIIGRPWLTRDSGGNLARTPGLHPYSLREVPLDF